MTGLRPQQGYRGTSVSPLALAAALALATPAAALAQTADPVHARTAVEEIIVTASPIGQRRFDVVQGTSVLTGEDLDRALASTIGQTLDRLPGVSQTAFGPGASRPVIRGLGGDRIRVLVGGIGTIDASTTSPDHAPAIELLTAKRVEVVRGPATLLYGNNAVGGVVNVLDGRIPPEAPKGGLEALARLGYGTNANERMAAAAVTGAVVPGLVLHADGFLRDSGNFKVPGYIESAALRALEEEEGEEHEEKRGRVENSDVDQMGGTLGASLVGDWGFFGLSVGTSDLNYGIAAGHAHEEEEGAEEEEEEKVRIDLEQTRYDLSGEITRAIGPFEAFRIRAGVADYSHVELEGDEVGTRFLNDGWEGRVEAVQREAKALGGTLSGAIGAQMSDRDFEAIGDEAFVPPSDTRQVGGFALQRLTLGALDLQAGARIERQTVESAEVDFDRGFTGISLSTGAGYTLPGGWLVGLALSRTERAPNAEELLSDGPHLATQTYELGDPSLGEETALGAEATVKFTADPAYAALNLFVTRYDDFIYERFTGAEADELPVAQFTAADARFVGFEVEAGTEARLGPGTLMMDGSVEYVRATDTDTDQALPRIPALSIRGGFGYEIASVSTRLELVWTDEQTRTGEEELPTEGSTVLNASVDWHPLAGRDISVLFEARNLTDEEVRLSSSVLKDRLPLPGRDFRVSLRAAF